MRSASLHLFLIALLPAGCVPAQVPGQWTLLPSLQQARQEVGAALLEDKLCISGGLQAGSPSTALDSMEVFDFTLNVWSSAAPMPAALDHHMMVAVDGLIYVIGGYVRPAPNTSTAVDTLYVYNPVSDTWSSAAPMPEARGGAWAVALGRKIYCFGGALGPDSFNTVFIYDVDGDSWTSGAAMPTARNHLNAVTDGTNVYVLGGRHGGSFAVNEKYIVAEDRWETLAPMPTARAAMACAYVDGRIYCAGGETPQLFDVNEVYDLASDTWSAEVPMAIPRHGTSAIVYDGAMVVAGGGTIQGLGPTNAVDRYTPPVAHLPGPGLALLLSAILAASFHFGRRKPKGSMS